MNAPLVAAVDWPTFWPATVNTTVEPLRHPWPVALVVPPGDIAVGSTTNCFGGGVGGNVVGGVAVVGLVVVGALVVVVVVAVSERCRLFGFLSGGRVVVVDEGRFSGWVVDVVGAGRTEVVVAGT